MDDHHFGYIIKLTTPQKSAAILYYCGGPIQLLKWDDEELMRKRHHRHPSSLATIPIIMDEM